MSRRSCSHSTEPGRRSKRAWCILVRLHGRGAELVKGSSHVLQLSAAVSKVGPSDACDAHRGQSQGYFSGTLSSFFEVLFCACLVCRAGNLDVEAIQAYMEQPLVKGLTGNMCATYLLVLTVPSRAVYCVEAHGKYPLPRGMAGNRNGKRLWVFPLPVCVCAVVSRELIPMLLYFRKNVGPSTTGESTQHEQLVVA